MMNLTLEERETLRSEKPLITAEKVEQLGVLLERLPESPRYAMIHGLQVSQFLTSSPFPPEQMSTLTLGELLEAGPMHLVLVDGIDDAHLDDLTEVLTSLIETSDEIIDCPSTHQQLPVPEYVPRYSSIEAERLVREGIDALVQSDRFEALKKERVEKYWNREAVAAPFLEALTFQELSKIEVQVLLKKRSITDLKIYHLIELLQTLAAGNKGRAKKRGGILPKWLADRIIRFVSFLSADSKDPKQ